MLNGVSERSSADTFMLQARQAAAAAEAQRTKTAESQSDVELFDAEIAKYQRAAAAAAPQTTSVDVLMTQSQHTAMATPPASQGSPAQFDVNYMQMVDPSKAIITTANRSASVEPQTRINNTKEEVDKLMSGPDKESDEALAVLRKNLDATNSPEERAKLWAEAGAPNFNQKFFTAEFDKAATERPSRAKADAVGEYIAGLHNISPEVANVMLDTVKSNFTPDWRASKYTGNGVQFYSGLSKLVEQAPERANEIGGWIASGLKEGGYRHIGKVLNEHGAFRVAAEGGYGTKLSDVVQVELQNQPEDSEDKHNREMREDLLTRAGGLGRMAVGAAEGVIAWGLTETGIGTVFAAPVAGLAGDNLWAGANEVLTGEPQETYFEKGVTETAKLAGASPETAEYIGMGADIAQNLAVAGYGVYRSLGRGAGATNKLGVGSKAETRTASKPEPQPTVAPTNLPANLKVHGLDKVSDPAMNLDTVRPEIVKRYLRSGYRPERLSIAVGKVRANGKAEYTLSVNGQALKKNLPDSLLINGRVYKVIKNDSGTIKAVEYNNQTAKAVTNNAHAEQKLFNHFTDNYAGQNVKVDIAVQNTSLKNPGMCDGCQVTSKTFAKHNLTFDVDIYEGSTGVNR